MSKVTAKYKKLRVLEDKQGKFYIQEQRLGFLWWTVFKTYQYKAALAFIHFSELDYNEKTGNFE